jgi:DNA-binding beta-propeller fold protein YncE
MFRRIFCLFMLGLFAAVNGLALADDPIPDLKIDSSQDRIVVANRSSGSISLIDPRTDEVVETLSLPSGPNFPEPMYIVHSRKRLFVGDRANSRVVVFNLRHHFIEELIPAGAGIFHMWGDSFDRQIWVNNDIDNTSTVIDPITLEVLATVPMPPDLTAIGGKPHDVIVDPLLGQFAYISMIGNAGPNDYVIKFSTRTFQEVGRAAVGKDPHLAASKHDKLLYVPCQNSNTVAVLNRATMRQIDATPIPGAHGARLSNNGKVFFTTNITSSGPTGLYAIDIRSNNVIGSVNTPYATPHNVMLTANGHKLYLTHSGATSNKVTVYKVFAGRSVPVLIGEVTVGFNPFGIALID